MRLRLNLQIQTILRGDGVRVRVWTLSDGYLEAVCALCMRALHQSPACSGVQRGEGRGGGCGGCGGEERRRRRLSCGCDQCGDDQSQCTQCASACGSHPDTALHHGVRGGRRAGAEAGLGLSVSLRAKPAGVSPEPHIGQRGAHRPARCARSAQHVRIVESTPVCLRIVASAPSALWLRARTRSPRSARLSLLSPQAPASQHTLRIMSSASSASALLASLQIAVHADVAGAVDAANALIARRQYRSAEQQLRAYLTRTQADINAAKAAAAASASASDVPAAATAAASASPSSLPTLSQLLTGIMPKLKQIASLQKEHELADYDLRTMQQETQRYKAEWAAYTQRKQDAGEEATGTPPSRPPHAEFVHTRVQVAAIAGRSRGLIASSHATTSASCVSAVAEGPPPVCIPAQTTILCCKAVGIVTDTEGGAENATAAAAAGKPALTDDEREERMASALVTLLALKMQAQPSLIKQLYRLDASERYEEDRARRLAQRSPLDAYRSSALPAAEAAAADESELEAADLEIDLERLALIVARNAFAPPSDSTLHSNAAAAEEEDNAAAPAATRSTGLWLPSSFLNHACHPNSHWFVVGDSMFVRTLRDVHEGEELTISYTGFDAKLARERQALCSGWGFQCECNEWCEPMRAHPALGPLEETFVALVDQLEPRVHDFVSAIHGAEEGTLSFKRAHADLLAMKSRLEAAVAQFRKDIAAQCGQACTGKGVQSAEEMAAAAAAAAAAASSSSSAAAASAAAPAGDDKKESEEAEDVAAPGAGADAAAPAAGSSSSSSAAKKKKKKKKAGAAAASAAAAVPSAPHTRQLLLHLSTPLQLLALLEVSVHDGRSDEAAYRASLDRHERLTLESLSLLSAQYGAGDETVVHGWLSLLNTWMQFATAGVEFRAPDQMQAVFAETCVAAHCAHFGTKPDHFQQQWNNTIQAMQLTELMQA